MKITLSPKYYLGELYSNGAWSRLTLFHYKPNPQGGSMSTPVAEVDIVDHPSRDGCNAHREIKISLRNDLKKIGDEVCIDGNKAVLRQPKDIMDISILNEVPSLLIREKLAMEPLSIYICVRHIDSFKVEGDFWNHE